MKKLSPPLLALFVGIAALLLYASWQVEARRHGATDGDGTGAAQQGVSDASGGGGASNSADAGGRDRTPFVVAPIAADGCFGDDDCVRVDADCCGLAGGGRCAAVNRRHVVEVARARTSGCRGVVCPSLVSQDPTCRGRLVCVGGRCALTDLPDAAVFGLGVKPIN